MRRNTEQRKCMVEREKWVQEIYKKKDQARLCKWDERIVLNILREKKPAEAYNRKKEMRLEQILVSIFEYHILVVVMKYFSVSFSHMFKMGIKQKYDHILAFY